MRGCLPQSHFLDICVFSPSLDFPEKSFVPHKHGERQPVFERSVLRGSVFENRKIFPAAPNSAHHKVGRKNPPRKVKEEGEVSQEDGRCCLHPSQWGAKRARSSSWTGFAWTRRVASPRKCPSLWQYWSPGMKKLSQACHACRGDKATSFALQGALSWYLFFFFFFFSCHFSYHFSSWV